MPLTDWHYEPLSVHDAARTAIFRSVRVVVERPETGEADYLSVVGLRLPDAGEICSLHHAGEGVRFAFYNERKRCTSPVRMTRAGH